MEGGGHLLECVDAISLLHQPSTALNLQCTAVRQAPHNPTSLSARRRNGGQAGGCTRPAGVNRQQTPHLFQHHLYHGQSHSHDLCASIMRHTSECVSDACGAVHLGASETGGGRGKGTPLPPLPADRYNQNQCTSSKRSMESSNRLPVTLANTLCLVNMPTGKLAPARRGHATAPHTPRQRAPTGPLALIAHPSTNEKSQMQPPCGCRSGRFGECAGAAG